MKSENSKPPLWQYDEFKHAGVDYADAMVAMDYDKQHQKFRDYEKDARLIIERLGLDSEHEVIDFGSGTGAFVIPAARVCKKVYAVDISPSMLDYCEQKLRSERLDNVETHCAGFLTYMHEGEAVDAILSMAALHHLPDFWKVVALHRMYNMLKPGGKLYLFDVVFSFPVIDYKMELDNWVNGMYNKADQAMAEETIIHIRDEFSTFDWIIEEMLIKTGFKIEQRYSDFPGCQTYLCIK